ncbi:ABC transporter permease [Leptothoe spongobia]|uniref:Transport permease protein n=1 Tax=Leptothoe spongobia TAU-MAC 1115 TaxID=1967444 RepID=A0A947DHC0_9CYAN|nr:ABC transporter permease [Leptothoe spongobia]MBT9316770.1 ABC transporter permease [Leptothoe spongobia TAU-MAC 1115]
MRLTGRQLLRLKPLVPFNEAQWAKLGLLKTLVQRDMEARYKGSILGNLWPLLNQLAQLLIYTYVFAIVLQVKLSLKGLSADNSFVFGLWLFAGLLPWIAFSSGLIQAASSVIAQPNLVKKVVFPLSLLPLIPVLSSFLESTFGLMALLVFVAFLENTLHPTLLLLPLVWLPQLLITAGLGYLTAGLTVFIRDIPQTLGVIINLWFYATPLIYPAEMIPAPFQQWVFWLNPLASIGEMYRDVILIGEVTHWGEWTAATGLSLIIFGIGFWCYKKLRPAFADVL